MLDFCAFFVYKEICSFFYIIVWGIKWPTLNLQKRVLNATKNVK